MKRIIGLAISLVVAILGCSQSIENIPTHLNSDEIAKIQNTLNNSKADEFTFVALGDNRDGDEVFTSFINEINNTTPLPLFAIDSGDLVPNGKDFQYVSFLKMIGKSKIPFLCLPGNHDYKHGTLLYRMSHTSGKELYTKCFGAPYYYFDLWGFRFITLDNANGSLDEEQISWLTKLLADGKKCFLFMHMPPPIGKWEAHCFRNGADSLLKLIKKENNILACFFGHIHGYGEKELNGVRLFVSGGAGAPLYDWDELKGEIDPVNNYMLVTLKKDSSWSYKVIKRNSK